MLATTSLAAAVALLSASAAGAGATCDVSAMIASTFFSRCAVLSGPFPLQPVVNTGRVSSRLTGRPGEQGLRPRKTYSARDDGIGDFVRLLVVHTCIPIRRLGFYKKIGIFYLFDRDTGADLDSPTGPQCSSERC